MKIEILIVSYFLLPAPDSWFAHLAVEVPGEETGTEWCEAVSDEEYQKLQ